jgi:hypothetical protein
MGMFSDLRKADLGPKPVPHKTREPGKTGTRDAVKPGIQEPGNPGFQPSATRIDVPSTAFDINRPPSEKETFLCTTDELEALEDLKAKLRRVHGLRGSKQDIERTGLQFLATDYAEHGEMSIVVQYLKKKTPR